MPKMMHCAQWHVPTESYTLVDKKLKGHQKVIQILCCPQCKKELYQWYAIDPQGRFSLVKAISIKEFYTHWVPDIEAGLVLKSQAITSQQRLYVSEYSRKVASGRGVKTSYLLKR